MLDKLKNGWLVIATLGEMNLSDIVNECQPGAWAPVLTFNAGQKTVVPVLDTQQKAVRFAQRNLPKEQLFGFLILTDENVVKLEKDFNEKGLVFLFLDHPKKMTGKPNVEIYEFVDKPDVYGLKKDMSSVAISYS